MCIYIGLYAYLTSRVPCINIGICRLCWLAVCIVRIWHIVVGAASGFSDTVSKIRIVDGVKRRFLPLLFLFPSSPPPLPLHRRRPLHLIPAYSLRLYPSLSLVEHNAVVVGAVQS